MALLLETLALLPASKPFFTANNAVNKVNVAQDTDDPPILYRLGLDSEPSLFVPVDNLMIMQMGVIMPYCYGIADEPFRFKISWANESGAEIQEIATLIIPQTCDPLSLQTQNDPGLFVAMPYLEFQAPNRRGQVLAEMIGTPTVAQVNAPDALNDEVLPIGFWMKIQHQFAMVEAAP